MRRNQSTLSITMFSFLLTSGTVTFTLLLCALPLVPCVTGVSASALASENFYATSESNESLKYIGDYRKDVKAFVKRSKSKEDPTQRFGAIVDLCMLHNQIVSDPRFGSNYQLQGFRAVTAERLKNCRKEIKREIKRLERAQAKSAKKVERQTESETSSDSPGSDDSPGSEDSCSDQLLDQHQLNQWMIQDMQTITQIAGGPIRLWNYTGSHHGPGICDFGPDLVRLIENTINPDFWRSNGGTGIIEYYQPLRILVVSASSQVHDNMADLLRTLRANGR